MPVINIALGKTTAEIKKELVAALTSAAASITQKPESAFSVFINEYADESIGVGGRTLSEIKAERQRTSPNVVK